MYGLIRILTYLNAISLCQRSSKKQRGLKHSIKKQVNTNTRAHYTHTLTSALWSISDSTERGMMSSTTKTCSPLVRWRVLRTSDLLFTPPDLCDQHPSLQYDTNVDRLCVSEERKRVRDRVAVVSNRVKAATCRNHITQRLTIKKLTGFQVVALTKLLDYVNHPSRTLSCDVVTRRLTNQRLPSLTQQQKIVSTLVMMIACPANRMEVAVLSSSSLIH